MDVPSHVSPVSFLATAFKNALVDPNTPKPLRDKLFLFVAQLRDSLPIDKALAADAAEAEAVISAFASPVQFQQQLDAQSPPGDYQATSARLAKPEGEY